MNKIFRRYPRFLAIGLVLILVGVAVAAYRSVIPQRQEVVRVKGSEVMPFDLDKTTHIFKSLDNGGLQQVVVKDVNDQENIVLVQDHLKKEAERFQGGNYSDPAFIHGMSMAGLSDLSQAAEKISIAYSALPNGAQILYTSTDQEIVNAIHAWFMAQTMDHGSDAIMH